LNTHMPISSRFRGERKNASLLVENVQYLLKKTVHVPAESISPMPWIEGKKPNFARRKCLLTKQLLRGGLRKNARRGV